MLKSVRKPDGSLVKMEYDALGRRIKKVCHEKVNRYLWDGNVLLHEWNYQKGEEPQTSVNDLGEVYLEKQEIIDNLVTWVYEERTFVPSAKIQGEERFSIISDYIGRPVQCYNENGSLVWSTEYDIYGGLRDLQGEKSFIPFRQLGQYEDAETGLYYNRHRYYSFETGRYLSQDPIGLDGGSAFYAYVKDSNFWIDIFGLSTVYLRNKEVYVGKAKHNAALRYGNKSTATDIFTGIPNTDTAQGVEQITYERMKIMEAAGDLDPLTNAQRPVDMGNKNKIYRRDLGEKWLKDTFGDNYEDIIDQKIKDHYTPLKMCK